MLPWFWDLLKSLVNSFGTLLHIHLYQDGACAGQMLNVDPAKSCQMFYFTIDELGMNRHCRCAWWWGLSSFRTRSMKHVRGGLSAVTRALLCELHRMRDGVLVQGPTTDEKMFLQFDLKVFITDESAMQSIWRFKGERAIDLLYLFARAASRLHVARQASRLHLARACVDMFNNGLANLMYRS